jgi:hypothetical protein
VTDSAADSLTHLYNAFGGSLYAAAENLVDRDNIRDVRVLQAGEVIVGIARPDASRGTAHRVYVRNRSRGPDRCPESAGIEGNGIEGECSCGERQPCVHVGGARCSQKPEEADNRRNKSPPFVRYNTASCAAIPARRANNNRFAICSGPLQLAPGNPPPAIPALLR